MEEYDGFFKHEVYRSHSFLLNYLIRFWDVNSRDLPAGRLEENENVAAPCHRSNFFPFPVCCSNVILVLSQRLLSYPADFLKNILLFFSE